MKPEFHKLNYKVRSGSLFSRLKPYQRELIYDWAYNQAVSLATIRERIASTFGISVRSDGRISVLLQQLTRRYLQSERTGRLAIGNRILLEIRLLPGNRMIAGFLPPHGDLRISKCKKGRVQ